jgi:uncharacterized repeat protein (TIGR03803 family)
MTSQRRFARILAAAAILFAGASSTHAAAAKYSVMHDFCSDANCADGIAPRGGLTFDSAGNLYGVTAQGGAYATGSVFRITPDGRLATLHTFCAQGCADGNTPQAALIVDVEGRLYGSTPRGGSDGGGNVFMLSPGGAGNAWKFRTLHNFCSAATCADGTGPAARLTYQGADSGLPYDGTSPLYGTTSLGGWNDAGIVFELKPDGHAFRERVIYTFCSQSLCADGGAPLGLTMDGSGNLFVATHGGGVHNGGTVLKLSPSRKKEWNAQVLYSFCALAHCADGSGPNTALLRDAQGNLYGGTSFGGNAKNSGVVFRLTNDGARWRESVLHVFCSDRDCRDGAQPTGAFVMDSAGVLYGLAGGSAGDRIGGAVWRLDGANYTPLHGFCRQGESCGETPVAGLIMDASGQLYGETASGGAKGGGAVFEVMP